MKIMVIYQYFITEDLFLSIRNNDNVNDICKKIEDYNNFVSKFSYKNLSKYKEILKYYVQFAIDNIVPFVNDEKILYLMIVYLFHKMINFEILEKFNDDLISKVCFEIDNKLFFFPHIVNNFNYDLEILVTLSEFPQYIPVFIRILETFNLDKILDLLLPKMNIGIINLISPVDFEKCILNLVKKSKYRFFYPLSLVLKDLLRKYERFDLVEVILKIYNSLCNSRESKIHFFYELKEILEWPEFSINICKKILNFSINYNDMYSITSVHIYCEKLIIEFERILRHPSLSNEAINFYCKEINRLNEIKDEIKKNIDRLIKIDLIKKNSAAKKIQNWWYNYITKLCHPENQFIIERFKNFREKNDSFFI